MRSIITIPPISNLMFFFPYSNPGSKRRVKGDSFSGDRPDSGFDSKDEEDVRLMPHNHQGNFFPKL